MPIYDYTCAACGHTVEVIHGIHDDGPRFCPSCGVDGRMKKAFNAPTIHFKGSGWAKKDRSATSVAARSKQKEDASSRPDGATGPGAADGPTGSAAAAGDPADRSTASSTVTPGSAAGADTSGSTKGGE